jgi:hypothetical protein
MDWEDLSDDATSLQRGQHELEREAAMCEADPMNGDRHRLYTVHVRQHTERLKQFIDKLIRLVQ